MRGLVFTDEQKAQMFDQLKNSIDNRDEMGVLEQLKGLGLPVPDNINQQPDEQDHARQQRLYAQEQARAHAQYEAQMRQRMGNQYNHPNTNQNLDEIKKQREEIKKMQEELKAERQKVKDDLSKMQLSMVTDKYNESVGNEVVTLRKKFPALEPLGDTELVEMVKRAKSDVYKDTKEIEPTERILKELHNEMATFTNKHIKVENDKIKLIEDEEDKQYIKDQDGKVLGTLDEEGRLVKTLTKDDTAGDKVAEKTKRKQIIEHGKQDEVDKDGVVKLDEEIDPSKIVEAAIEARDGGPSLHTDEAKSKIQDILTKADERDSDGGEDGTGE